MTVMYFHAASDLYVVVICISTSLAQLTFRSHSKQTVCWPRQCPGWDTVTTLVQSITIYNLHALLICCRITPKHSPLPLQIAWLVGGGQESECLPKLTFKSQERRAAVNTDDIEASPWPGPSWWVEWCWTQCSVVWSDWCLGPALSPICSVAAVVLSVVCEQYAAAGLSLSRQPPW